LPLAARWTFVGAQDVMDDQAKSSQAPASEERFSRGPDESPEDPQEEPGGNPAADAVRAVGQFLGEIKAYGRDFLSAKTDRLGFRAKRVAIYGALGVVGLLIGGGLVITACLLFLHGLAVIIGRALWQQFWLGEVVVGLVVLGGIALGVMIGISRF